MRRAILSVSDKTGLISFGRRSGARVELDRGHREGTGRGRVTRGERQRRNGLSRNDGRPRQDAPSNHGGIPRGVIVGRFAAAERHGIGLVDLVVVNLYPFVETRKRISSMI